LSIGDLFGQRRRHDEIGDLGEGELHLSRVDALALVLRSQVPSHPLALEHHELVELAVLVALACEPIALLTHASQLLFELLDASVRRHDEALLPRAIATNKWITSLKGRRSSSSASVAPFAFGPGRSLRGSSRTPRRRSPRSSRPSAADSACGTARARGACTGCRSRCGPTKAPSAGCPGG